MPSSSSSSSSTEAKKRNSSGKCPFIRKRQNEGELRKHTPRTTHTKTASPADNGAVTETNVSSSTSDGGIAQVPTGNSGYDSGGMGFGGGGYGMGGYGMGMGMGGYGMGMGMGMGGYGMGMGGYGDGGFMGPLMNQLMMVQSLNYTLMSFGHIVQSLGINAGSILQFGLNVLRTLDSLAIAIKKSGILSPTTSRSAVAISDYQQGKNQQIRRRRRAVLIRWTLVFLTMAVTSQIMRILKFFSNSSMPSALAQKIYQFFRSFFTADVHPTSSSLLNKEASF